MPQKLLSLKSLLLILAVVFVVAFVYVLFRSDLNSAQTLPSTSSAVSRPPANPSPTEATYVASTVEELSKHVTHSLVASWQIPLSAKQGVPIVTAFDPQHYGLNTLYIYDFNTNTSRVADTNVAYYGGVLGCGDREPKASHDFRYTAYTDHNNDLYILSNETLEKKLVYHADKDASLYMLAWSPNSKKLIFCQLGLYNDEVTSVEALYYLFNMKDGSLMTIPKNAKVDFYDFLDDTTVIAEVIGADHRIIHTAVNLDTLRTDQTLFEKKLGFTTATSFGEYDPSYAFSLDRTKVAYNKEIVGSDQEPMSRARLGGESDIIFANLLSRTKEMLAQGVYAQYQKPIISPDGTMVAYDDVVRSPANSPSRFWTYNLSTKKATVYERDASRVLQWLDSDKLLFASYGPPSAEATTTYFILTPSTGSIIRIP